MLLIVYLISVLIFMFFQYINESKNIIGYILAFIPLINTCIVLIAIINIIIYIKNEFC